jgi:glucuronate isomerase
MEIHNSRTDTVVMGRKTVHSFRPLIHRNFLLENKFAEQLYFEHAADMPIIDYHCHLSPMAIAANTQFENLTQVWLNGDHYKWRAMRTCGIDERFITGDASDLEKFEQWAAVVPKTLRNPLYHWTHMELKRPFGIEDVLLNATTARRVWEECNAKLATPSFSTRGILEQMNVEVVCTTDDPVDTLEYHKAMMTDQSLRVMVFPAFRPDNAMAVEDPVRFKAYVASMEKASGLSIGNIADFLQALRKRHDFFHQMGCRISDHGIETMYAEEYSDAAIKTAFDKLMAGTQLDQAEIVKFKSAILYECAVMDWEKGWVQQYHLGALRNNNTRMMGVLGRDTGYDSIGDFEIARPLAKFLDRLDREEKLAKTILYNLNPRDNEVLASMIGNFQNGAIPGKVQYGAAWWFLDQKDGMTKQIEALSNLGLLSQFVGMLTDSRSFLSYPRHEYFRRLLCNILGDEMKRGLIPDDMELVGSMVSDICYRNAKRYFKFVGVA